MDSLDTLINMKMKGKLSAACGYGLTAEKSYRIEDNTFIITVTFKKGEVAVETVEVVMEKAFVLSILETQETAVEAILNGIKAEIAKIEAV